MDEPQRPDCRRFLCDLCGATVYICSWCDRGNRYCPETCAVTVRKLRRKEAGERYQRTRRGRLRHAAREASYRERLRADEKKVTHHGCPEVPRAESLPAWEKPSTAPQLAANRLVRVAIGPLICAICHFFCGSWIRNDLLRRRRPRRSGVRDDLRRSVRRNPSTSSG